MESKEAQENIHKVTPYTFGASAFLVIGANTKEAWVRDCDQRNFGNVDASIVATHIMLAVHEVGLGTTWVGNFDIKQLKQMYKEMDDYDLVAIFPIGYPAKDATPAASHSKKKDKSKVVTTL